MGGVLSESAQFPPCGSVTCVLTALLLSGPLLAITVQQVCTSKCVLLSSVLPNVPPEVDDMLLIFLFLFFVGVNLAVGGAMWTFLRYVATSIHGQMENSEFFGKRFAKSAYLNRNPNVKRSKSGRFQAHGTRSRTACDEVYRCSFCDRPCRSKIGLYSHELHCTRRPRNCKPCYGGRGG